MFRVMVSQPSIGGVSCLAFALLIWCPDARKYGGVEWAFVPSSSRERVFKGHGAHGGHTEMGVELASFPWGARPRNAEIPTFFFPFREMDTADESTGGLAMERLWGLGNVRSDVMVYSEASIRYHTCRGRPALYALHLSSCVIMSLCPVPYYLQVHDSGFRRVATDRRHAVRHVLPLTSITCHYR